MNGYQQMDGYQRQEYDKRNKEKVESYQEQQEQTTSTIYYDSSEQTPFENCLETVFMCLFGGCISFLLEGSDKAFRVCCGCILDAQEGE